MSNIAKQLFEGLRGAKDAAQAGLSEALTQAKPEMARLGTQGSMEVASALFSGQGFVPYGPGQQAPSQAHEMQRGRDQGIER